MRALLLQPAPLSPGRADHFAGVASALAERGIAADRSLVDTTRPSLPADTRLVAVSDSLQPITRHALRLAREQDLPAVLLMDGLCDWRNTHANPRVGRHFLQPAPVHTVCCAGTNDAAILEQMGNTALPTGLPRLDALDRTVPPGDHLLIATANRPFFNQTERQQLAAGLIGVRDEAAKLNIPVRWRLTGGLNRDLRVTNDPRPLSEALADARAVLTTPSTLLAEAMLADRPAGLLHPYPTPLWQPAAWNWLGGASGREALRDMLRSLMDPSPEARQHQQAALERLHPTDGRSAHRVADAIADLVRTRPAAPPPPMLSLVVKPDPPPPPTRNARVLHLVWTEGEPCGDDPTACTNLPEQHIADDHHTLYFTPVGFDLPDAQRPRAAVCVLPRDLDHTEMLRIAVESARSFEPALVCAHGGALPRMAAAALRLTGVQTTGFDPKNKPNASVTAPSDDHLYAHESWKHPKNWADAPDRALTYIRSQLELGGYQHITLNAPEPGTDAVILEGQITPELIGTADAFRARGLGVALSPTLIEPEWVRMTQIIKQLASDGCSRIAIYGAGGHTRRAHRLFDRGLPIVGIIDDTPQEPELFGLPIVRTNEALARLSPDAVVLSSDAWEDQMWQQTTELRRAGVRVKRVYAG